MPARDKKSKPAASELGKLRAWLAKQGVALPDANQLVQPARTRGEIALALTVWLRGRQKNDRQE